ncbi:hypothetical protein B0H10DRAFT_1944834 [Mycena sp. CBHHK59/15]|nr:hypothetical protein B0H10DRAFT_1944834 [Mycena sp. CBHHK59/15]
MVTGDKVQIVCSILAFNVDPCTQMGTIPWRMHIPQFEKMKQDGWVLHLWLIHSEHCFVFIGLGLVLEFVQVGEGLGSCLKSGCGGLNFVVAEEMCTAGGRWGEKGEEKGWEGCRGAEATWYPYCSSMKDLSIVQGTCFTLLFVQIIKRIKKALNILP